MVSQGSSVHVAGFSMGLSKELYIVPALSDTGGISSGRQSVLHFLIKGNTKRECEEFV